MKGWINDLRNLFDRKAHNVSCKKKNLKTGEKSFVKERVTYFNEIQQINKNSTGSAIDDGCDRIVSTHYRKRRSSCDSDMACLTRSNLERTPSMVVNTDKICIYQSMDAIYGSFKIRERSVFEGSYEENDVIMRIKVREIEHRKVSRYESKLKAPLPLPVMAEKCDSDISTSAPCPEPVSKNKVMTLINMWDRLSIDFYNNKRGPICENDILNSIDQTNSISTDHEKHLKIIELLGDNQILNWVDTERVISMNLVNKLSREEINFQEAQFELIFTEATYYRSLNTLVDIFYHSPQLSIKNANTFPDCQYGIKPHQKEHLFSNILQIHATSGRFLAELENRFEESVVMKDICDIVITYAEKEFSVYIPYIQNQKFQTESYNELRKNPNSAKLIKELEEKPECCFQTLDSFLLLPMRRMLQILLLLKSIKKNIPEGNLLSLNSVNNAITAMDNVIALCCAKKDQMDERQRMLEICQCLRFSAGQNVKAISSGTLIYDGEVKCQKKITAVKGYRTSTRRTVFFALLILTNEYLVITKIIKNKDLCYLVEDICELSDVVVESTTGKYEHKSRTSIQFAVSFRKSITYVIQPRTSVEYNRWIKELSNCIEQSSAEPKSPKIQ